MSADAATTVAVPGDPATTGTPGPPDASLGHLLGRVAVLEVAVRRAVAQRSAGGDPDPGDPLRGTYLSDDYVAWLLDRRPSGGHDDGVRAMRDRLERDADGAETRGVDVRLRRLSRAFGLTVLEEEVLVAVLTPMVDRRFGPLLAYLNDDVTRRWATVAVAVELAQGQGPGDPRDWRCLAPGSRLVADGLVEVTDPGEPLPGRSVRPTDRVAAFLLGDDALDPDLVGHVVQVVPLPLVDPTLAASGSPHSCQVRQHPGTDAEAEVATWLSRAGQDPLVVRPPQHPEHAGPVVRAALRECLLTGRPLVLGPVDGLVATAEGRAHLDRLLRRLPVVVLWLEDDVAPWSAVPLPEVELVVPSLAHRVAAWAEVCAAHHLPQDDVSRLARYRLGAAVVRRAVDLSTVPGGRDVRVGRPALEEGVRALERGAMRGLANRTAPRRGWSDLVLPAATEQRLRELVAVVRHRDAVVDDWGLGRGTGSRGVCALFAGRSGTGKTLAAEVVAGELGVELWTVDLAQVVDKYVGETEKNLDRVLRAAEGVTGVLFFDEADAIFGRRGEVRGGQDRYANLEVSYLLQRIEAAGAVVVLATNLRSQVDEAFLRRVDTLVEFADPGPDAREAIWRRHLSRLALGPDVDLAFCAASFELTGGSIRNAVTAAACLAADVPRPVAMADLVRGLEREYEKLGRLRVRADFGPYAHLLSGG